MSRCVGFEPSAQIGRDSLPCHPSTVVYGHTASRGLDVHRWTVGLDTGCVRDSSIAFFVSTLMIRVQIYGRRLTALILDSGTTQSRRESISLGIQARAYNSRDDSEDDDDGDGGEEGSDGVKRDGIPFGDNGQARLVSVECHKPK